MFHTQCGDKTLNPEWSLSIISPQSYAKVGKAPKTCPTDQSQSAGGEHPMQWETRGRNDIALAGRTKKGFIREYIK